MNDQRAGQESILPRHKKGFAAHSEETTPGTPTPSTPGAIPQLVKGIKNQPAHAPNWNPVLSESWSIDQLIQQVRDDKLFMHLCVHASEQQYEHHPPDWHRAKNGAMAFAYNDEKVMKIFIDGYQQIMFAKVIGQVGESVREAWLAHATLPHDKEIATYLAYPTETAQYARDRLRAAGKEAEQTILDQLSVEAARGYFRGRIEDIER
jgi:hypothetical protein